VVGALFPDPAKMDVNKAFFQHFFRQWGTNRHRVRSQSKPGDQKGEFKAHQGGGSFGSFWVFEVTIFQPQFTLIFLVLGKSQAMPPPYFFFSITGWKVLTFLSLAP